MPVAVAMLAQPLGLAAPTVMVRQGSLGFPSKELFEFVEYAHQSFGKLGWVAGG